VIFTVVTSANCVMVKKKKNFGTKRQQQVQDNLLLPFSAIGSTSSAYFTESKWS